MAAQVPSLKMLLIVAGLMNFLAASAYSQTASTAFQRSLTYFSSIQELDTKFDGLRTAGMKLITERQDAFNRLIETRQVVAQIADAKAARSFELVATQMMALSKQAELNWMVNAQTQKSPIESGVDVRHTPATQLRAQIAAREQADPLANKAILERGNNLAQTMVQCDMIAHQMKTLNAAGKLAVDRHVSILKELEKIVNEMLLWDAKTVELFDKYWSLADVSGVKSDEELRAGLQQLNRSSDANAGALLLKSITLIRMEQYDDATAILSELANIPALHVLVMTINAEVLARTGKQKEALAILRKTARMGLNDPRIRMHCAMAFAAFGELKAAEDEWEAVLKIGGHEVASRRAIAFINAASTTPTERTKATSLENAQLAVKLDEAEWASKIAFALATAANGEFEQASKLATEAAELATGSNQALCDEIAEQLLAGKNVSWKM